MGKGNKTMRILHAIECFPKEGNPHCSPEFLASVPTVRKEGNALLGAWNPLLLKHNEVLCKEIKDQAYILCGDPVWCCFHVGLLCSTIHNQKEMWVTRKRKEAMAKIPKLACVLFKKKYTYIFLNKMFILKSDVSSFH